MRVWKIHDSKPVIILHTEREPFKKTKKKAILGKYVGKLEGTESAACSKYVTGSGGMLEESRGGGGQKMKVFPMDNAT
jgi:hypothetical protein